MKSYVDNLIVRDSNGEEAILYPNTKQEAVEGLMERLANVEKPDITTTTDTTMPNSHKGRLMFNEIGGVCEQDSTAGAQLWNGGFSAGQIDNSTGVLGTGDLAISNPIYLASESTYTITHNLPNGVRVFFYDTAGNHLSNLLTQSGVTSFTTPENTSHIRLKSSQAHFGTNLMLNEGTTPLPWEPYTGGIPSPNPDYPQEIKKTVVSEIKTHGKNCLPNTTTSQSRNGVTFTVNDDKSITVNGQPTERTDVTIYEGILRAGTYILSQGHVSLGKSACIYLTYRDDNDNRVYIDLFTNTSGKTQFTIDKDREITVRADVRYATISVSNVTLYPMIREASIADDTYEPYKESVITLSQPIELYGIGDVQDVIEDGKVKRRFKKVVLDGSESGWSINSPGTENAFLAATWIKDRAKTTNNYCSHFTHANIQTVTKDVGYSCTSSDTGIRFRPPNVETWTLDSWKAHLQANPMTVVYELAEEVIEELPLADKIALNSLATFDGITYLEFDSEIKPTFKGEYGTSKVGGMALESLLTARNNDLRLSSLEASVVNNI